MTASTLSGNDAGEGGGIYSQNVAAATSVTVINSTIADNSANQGGGIYNHGSILPVTSSTIAYNVDSGYGAGIYNQSGPPTWTTRSWPPTPSARDSGQRAGHGRIALSDLQRRTTSSVSDDTGNLSGNGNLVGITDLGLGLWAYNGGPTQTIALLAGSPAIDAGSIALAVDQNGNPLTTDQRGAGYPRIIDSIGRHRCLRAADDDRLGDRVHRRSDECQRQPARAIRATWSM